MKLRKKIAIITVAATVSLFANGMANVSSLVDQINKSSDIKERSALLKKLDVELSVMDKKEALKAKSHIETNLKKLNLQ